MSALRRFLLRLYNVVALGRAEDGLAREIESHLALLADEFERKGMSREEARLAARRAFGGVDQAKELQREARSFLWLEDARRDAGYAIRTLSRAPGFTAAAVLTLALGVGAVTVIYSVVRNVVLDPFPYQHSDRLVDVLVLEAPGGRILRGPLPVPEFLDYQEQSQVFEDVAGALGQGMHHVSDAGAEWLSVIWVTPNTFAFLGVQPLLGRAFDALDARPDAPKVAVMNHRTWVTSFGAEPSVVGRTLVVNHEPRTVVGVMPPRFEWHVGDLWIPGPLSRADSNAARTQRWFQARLKRGVSVQEAEAQMNLVAARRAKVHPGEYPEKFHIQVITIIDWVVGRFRRVLYTLFGAVGLLLVIACCNVANMLLARAASREREISLRAALGASRGRIVRQLLMESALLALGGAGFGCLLAYAGIQALAQLMPRSGVAWEAELRLDQPVLVFALVATALSTLAFGLVPALQGARRELMVGSASRSGTASRRQTRMRNGLVIAEVALSVVLLLAAGLLMRTFVKLVGVDLGFDPSNLLEASAAFAPDQAQSAPAQQRFYRDALERLNALPVVSAAAVSNGGPPFSGMRSPLEVLGNATAQPPSALVQFCSEQYASVLGLRLVEGRHLSAADVAASAKVAVVNQTLARQHLRPGRAVGQSIRLSRLATLPAPVADPTFEIVGVVADVANQGVRDPPAPHAYLAYPLRGPASLEFIVRTAGDPKLVATAIRREMRAVDPMVAVEQPSTMEDRLKRIHAQARFSLVVLAMFAGTGVLLVGLGVYGVLAYTVSQQTRQIAIRMALGGDRRDVLLMVFRAGLTLLGAGLLAGLVASVATNRLLESQLWQLSPHDPATLVGAVSIIASIGIAACWVPARRATRVELLAALKDE